ncbi:MAG TPA: protein kinase [Streptosporangiaceae bacterium]
MQAVTGPGRVVAGRYELLDRIGQGAMGTVWRARDLVLTRDVAIKEVRLPGLMPDEDRKVLRERTMREARVSAKLNHPGVVTVYDVIETGGTPWIVMELVAARSLERVLAQDGALPPRQVASIGVMLLGALASAHAAGIVHRDVKPGNVLITSDGRAVLTDFGIATLDGDPGLTQAGMVMGTPGFCAPERIRGEPASPASDLWSLGATLYAAVEGRGPFEGHDSPMAVLASIVHSDPPPVRAGGQLGTVIHSLMSKDPAQRPDAACAIRLLADVAAGNAETVAAASPHPGTRPAGLVSAVDSTDPTGFPASGGPAGTPGNGGPGMRGNGGPGTPGNGGASAPGHGFLPSPPLYTPGGTAQFPAGADAGWPGTEPGADIPAAAAPAADMTTQTAPGHPAGITPGVPAGGVPAAASFPANAGDAPFHANAGEVPFPDGVGDVKFPVRAGAVVPPWAGPGWAGSPASGGGSPGGPGGADPARPAAPATVGPVMAAPVMASPVTASPPTASPVMASPVTGSPVTGSPSMGRPVMAGPAPAGPGQPPPWAPGPPGSPGPPGTAPRAQPRSTGSWVLALSLAGAAIVMIGLVAGVLFARASGGGKPSSGGTGGSSPAASSLPAGYHWYTQSAAAGTAAGFAMAVPDGWQGGRQGRATYLRDPATGGTITASFAPFTVSGPVQEARVLELQAVSRGTYPGYRRIALAPWLLRGQLAGAWRFSYQQPGTGLVEGLEVVSRLPTAGGQQPYEMLVTAPVAQWPASKAAFAEALRTLRAGS